jgi:hypothetical protein
MVKGLVTMSEIRWCDIGGHPFSLLDPDRQAYSKVNADGEREWIDVCGEHDIQTVSMPSFPDRREVEGGAKDA